MIVQFQRRYYKETVCAHAEVLMEHAAGCLQWVACSDPKGRPSRERMRAIFMEMAKEAFDRTIPKSR